MGRKPLSMILTLLCISVLFSCASNPQYYEATTGDMAITVADSSLLEKRHFTVTDMKNWSVLVLDTINTKETHAYMLRGVEGGKKYKNYGVARDCDPEPVFTLQNALFNAFFGKVSYEREEGVHYDAIILRDYLLYLRGYSGKKNESLFMLWFVYDAQDVPGVSSEWQYVFRGRYDVTEYAVTPYPATSLGVQEGNRLCITTMTELLHDGVDLYTLK